MMEWKVIESRAMVRQLQRAPKVIQEKYAIWRNRVRRDGPYLQGGYCFHALEGNRRGQKSIRLNLRWRVIFKVFEGELVVEALELTPHKY